MFPASSLLPREPTAGEHAASPLEGPRLKRAGKPPAPCETFAASPGPPARGRAHRPSSAARSINSASRQEYSIPSKKTGPEGSTAPEQLCSDRCRSSRRPRRYRPLSCRVQFMQHSPRGNLRTAGAHGERGHARPGEGCSPTAPYTRSRAELSASVAGRGTALQRRPLADDLRGVPTEQL
jgi:hypothetical protein